MPRRAWTRDRKRHRSICPNGATHTSPGHRPGNRIPENRCVLKEHRIGWAGVDIRDTGMMRRSFRTRVCFDGRGFPGLVCGVRVAPTQPCPLHGDTIPRAFTGRPVGHARRLRSLRWLLSLLFKLNQPSVHLPPAQTTRQPHPPLSTHWRIGALAIQ
jgi:hypothetical protein